MGVKFVPTGRDANTPPDLPEVPSRFRPTGNDELSFEDIHGDMSWLDKLLVSMGRGVSDIGQGMKQGYLMATDPVEAERYTEEVNEDIRRYEKLSEQAPFLTGTGRLIGNIGPSLAFPFTGIGTTAALGAVEGASMFTPEADLTNKAVNTGLGAGLAGAGQSLINMFTKMPKPSTPEALEALKTAVDTGFPLRPQDISSNQAVQFVGGASDSALIGKNILELQGQRADALARKAVNQFDDVDSLLESAKRRIRQEKVTQKEIYAVLDDLTARAGQINPEEIHVLARELIQKQIDTGLPSITVVNKLKKIAEAQPAENSFAMWKALRTQIGDNMVLWNKEGRKASDLKAMYGAVTDEMTRVVDELGPGARAAFDDANALTSEMINRADTPVGRMVRKNDDTKLNNILTGKGFTKDSKEAAANLFNSLDEAGQEAGRRRLLELAYENAKDPKGVFSPKAFAANINGVKNRAGVFFKDHPEQLTDVNNLANMLAHVKDPAEAKSLSQMIIPMSMASIGGGAGAMVGAPALGAAAGIAASQFALPAIARPRSVSAMLEAIAKAEPGSSKWNELKRELLRKAEALQEGEFLKQMKLDFLRSPAYLFQKTAAPVFASMPLQPDAPAGMQIDIRNGIPASR